MFWGNDKFGIAIHGTYNCNVTRVVYQGKNACSTLAFDGGNPGALEAVLAAANSCDCNKAFNNGHLEVRLDDRVRAFVYALGQNPSCAPIVQKVNTILQQSQLQTGGPGRR